MPRARVRRLVGARVPSPLDWTLFSLGQQVRGAVLVKLLSALVEGRPFPGSRPVVDHPTGETPSANRRAKSVRQQRELSAAVGRHSVPIVVPVAVALSRPGQITTARAVVEGACRIVVPALGLVRLLFTIPDTSRVSVPLRHTLVLDMADWSVLSVIEAIGLRKVWLVAPLLASLSVTPGPVHRGPLSSVRSSSWVGVPCVTA